MEAMIANEIVNNKSNLMEATRVQRNLNLIESKDEEYCFIMKLTTDGEIEHLDTAIKFEAHDIYTEIKKKYVNSAAYQDIDKYIERTAN